jgi:signal transduction histidine kinase
MHKLIQQINCWRSLFLLIFLSIVHISYAKDNLFLEGNPIWEQHYLKLSHKIAPKQGWFERKNGEIVITNGSSILVFNGISTQSVKSLGDRTIFSIAESPSGDLYYTSIGHLDCINHKQEEINLTPLFDCPLPQTASTIHIVPNKENSLFLKTNHEIYYLKDNSGSKIYSTHGIISIAFFCQEKFYIVDSEKGLLCLEPESPNKEHVIREILKSQLVFSITDTVALSSESTVAATSNSKLYLFNGDKFKPIPVFWDEGIPAPNILQIKKLDKNIVVLTDENCIRIIDKYGKIQERIPYVNSDGFVPDSIITDHQGGIWVHSPNHISRVQPQYHLKEYSYRNNLPSSIDSVCIHKGTIYVGTENGLYTLNSEERNFNQFISRQKQPIKICALQDWLLYNTSQGITAIRDSEITDIPTNNLVLAICPSKKQKNTFYCIGENFISAYSFIEDNWRQTLYEKIPKGYYSYVFEGRDNNLWIGPSFGKIIQIRIFDDGSCNVKTPKLDLFKDTQIYPIKLRNHVYFLSRNGSAEWDNRTQQPLVDAAYSQLLPFSTNEISKVIPDNINRWWIQTGNTIGYLDDNNSHIQWHKAPLSRLTPINIKSVFSDNSNNVYLAANEKVVICELNKDQIHKTNKLSILSASLTSPKGNNKTIHINPNNEPLTVTLNGNDLKFVYLLDNKIRSDLNLYRFKMEGVSDQWSRWITSNKVGFYKLYPGKYRLFIEGKDYDGNISKAQSPLIIIDPPWYLTKWAYGFYICGVIALLFVIMNLRIRYVARKTNDLRLIIEQKTSEISKRNDKLAQTIDQLNQINKQLKITNSEKDELLAIVSHDLKNPLSAIINLSQILQNDLDALDKNEIKEHSGEIEDSAEMMYQIIRNLLDLNRLEQGRINVKLSPCRLYDIAREVLEHNYNKANRKQIKLHLAPPDDEAICLGEVIFLKQVLENLISNAIKYSPLNSNIHVAVYERRNKIICDVKDEGPGIKPEERHMLFERFAKLSAQPTAGEHSSGLGLAIVKRLTETMKGRVSCISLPNDGSTFRVSFLKANAINLAKAHKHR